MRAPLGRDLPGHDYAFECDHCRAFSGFRFKSRVASRAAQSAHLAACPTLVAFRALFPAVA